MPTWMPTPPWQPLIGLAPAPSIVTCLAFSVAPPATRIPYRLSSHVPAGHFATTVRPVSETTPGVQIEISSCGVPSPDFPAAASHSVVEAAGVAGGVAVGRSEPLAPRLLRPFGLAA